MSVRRACPGPLAIALTALAACASPDRADRERADACMDGPAVEVTDGGFVLILRSATRDGAGHALLLDGAFDDPLVRTADTADVDLTTTLEGGNPFDEADGLQRLIGRRIPLRARAGEQPDRMLVVVDSERDLADVACAVSALPEARDVAIRRALPPDG